jgi:CHRD domain
VRPPGTPDPVESRASGFAFAQIVGTKLHFVVVIFNPARESFILGHIHSAPVGVNGPIFVDLFMNASGVNPFVFTQSDSIDIGDKAEAICNNLPGFYFNYHTTQDPQGAVRGQLG